MAPSPSLRNFSARLQEEVAYTERRETSDGPAIKTPVSARHMPGAAVTLRVPVWGFLGQACRTGNVPHAPLLLESRLVRPGSRRG